MQNLSAILFVMAIITVLYKVFFASVPEKPIQHERCEDVEVDNNYQPNPPYNSMDMLVDRYKHGLLVPNKAFTDALVAEREALLTQIQRNEQR